MPECYIEGAEPTMSNLALRRAAAFIIDYAILCGIFFTTGICGIVLANFLAEPISLERINRFFEIDKMLTFGSICLFALWIYFFLLDYYENIDMGKKLTGIELLSDNQKLTVNKKLKHSILKCIFVAIWPVSFIYYVIKGHMIYDKCLKISIRDKVNET